MKSVSEEAAEAARERLAARGVDTRWMGTGGYVVDPGSAESDYWEDQAKFDQWVADGHPDIPGLRVTKEDRELLNAAPLTVSQAALRENVAERTVYRWLKSGELVGDRVGTHWRIPREELDRRRIESRKPKPVATTVVKKRVPRKKAVQASDTSWWPS